jgi:tRNA (guanine-N7-)-methyltransferase
LSTYLRRRGRLTKGQARALAEHSGAAVVDASGPVDWTERFGRVAPLGVEIGFGMGQSLVDWAMAAPHMNLIGIDVYQPGIGAVLNARQDQDLAHLLVIEADARQAMEVAFAPDSIQEVRIFFPDPWPKKRHHKRRLVQPPFVTLLTGRLVPGGRLRLATDWQNYAEQMLQVLEQEPGLVNETDGGFAARFEQRGVTRFEARGQRLGHPVWDLCFKRQDSARGETSACGETKSACGETKSACGETKRACGETKSARSKIKCPRRS